MILDSYRFSSNITGINSHYLSTHMHDFKKIIYFGIVNCFQVKISL